ncbi:L-selectin [uncultured Mediterranea sp.]|uniref:L-selectin n=1 Tax=uncultured Mediterranea sp. TaxID=1926662 RepID=UPI0027D99493|nr:L-selectin [uncultured Mediterranea sp.]
MDRTAELKLSERVILVDVSFLNRTVGMVREVMAARLGRPLPVLDLAAWLDCLLLDAGIRDFSSAEVQVLLVQGTDGDALSACMPSLLSDLDGMACRTGLAEYVFSVVPTEKMATAETLYRDLLALVLNNASVRQALLVPAMSADEEKLNEVTGEVLRERRKNAEGADVQAVWFGLERPSCPVVGQWCPVVPSLAHVLGIREEELR